MRIIRKKAVLFKEQKPESLGLFIIMKKTDVPEALWRNPVVDSPLIIKMNDGKNHPEYNAIKLTMGFPPW